jgi:hypothetical protein
MKQNPSGAATHDPKTSNNVATINTNVQ